MIGDNETIDEQLKNIYGEIEIIDSKINRYITKKNDLIEKRDALKDRKRLSKSLSLAQKDWSQKFQWTEDLKTALKNVFQLTTFRPQQLKTINAIMSNQDIILVAPTGGGKSLCFQLPAIISDGITIVISPLISLMEDQVWSMRKLGIEAQLLCSTTNKVNANAILKMLSCTVNSSLKLLYVTPERLAKSKRFMSMLQKCYLAMKLDRIAIDEVHCCSQWGHDFRPDYKYLGNLKTMFPNVPILGVTATATNKVIIDVQKMLNIQDSIVFHAPFNRPNLYYQVIDKPADKEDQINLLAELLENRYINESGIIYTYSIKDADDITNGLISRGLKVRSYHANLESERRSKIHMKWITGRLQAVVATVAFGMGIDKPDVRFVIHHTLSKSIENFYQESGRAGRDGERAECILLYRFADVFRISTMMFTEHVGLKNAYSMIEYCINVTECRRKIISSHFTDVWKSSDCDNMCDICLNPDKTNPIKLNINPCLKELLNIIDHSNEVKLTGLKLLDAWYHNGPKNLRLPNSVPPKISRRFGEHIITHLILKSYLKEDFHFTAFATNSYITRGPIIVTSELKEILLYVSTTQTLPIEKNYTNSDIEFVSEVINIRDKKKKKKKSSSRKRNLDSYSSNDNSVVSSSTKTPSSKKKIKKRRSSNNDNNDIEDNETDFEIVMNCSLTSTSENSTNITSITNFDTLETEQNGLTTTPSSHRKSNRISRNDSDINQVQTNLHNDGTEQQNDMSDVDCDNKDLINSNADDFVKCELNDVILVNEEEVIIEIDDNDDND